MLDSTCVQCGKPTLAVKYFEGYKPVCRKCIAFEEFMGTMSRPADFVADSEELVRFVFDAGWKAREA